MSDAEETCTFTQASMSKLTVKSVLVKVRVVLVEMLKVLDYGNSLAFEHGLRMNCKYIQQVSDNRPNQHF